MAVHPRIPPIDEEPIPSGTTKYTEYKPQPSERVRDEVLRVTGANDNPSFVSRCLLMITRRGNSKNFETITGLDGLTFGISDFASDGGIHEFMSLLAVYYPQRFEVVFGRNTPHLLDKNWIKDNNAGGHAPRANNAGLIRFPWLREGLDTFLSDNAYYGLQLQNFMNGKVSPSLKTFHENNFDFEFTLATMIGIANSRGAHGMRTDLAEVQKNIGDVTELELAKHLLTDYVEKDRQYSAPDRTLLELGFGGDSNLSDKNLSHRGRRALELFQLFPYVDASPFLELGEFNLADDEKLPTRQDPPA